MIKLYILYAVLGFYMLYYGLLYWFFPFEDAMLQVWLVTIAALVLFFIAPAICLYRPKIAPVVGLLCLAGISPFGIHWVQYKVLNEYFMVWKPENILMYIAVVWYFVTLVVTINTYTVRHNLKVKYYSRRIKLSLAFLPLMIVVVFAGYVWLAVV